MARLSSAFESRPESGSILDLLEAQCSNARRHLANTAIGLQGLAQRGSIFGPHPNYGPDIEPLPVIDYHLLSILINLSRPSLDPRDLKRFDYLADARKNYYRAHQEFEYCYRGLQDVAANGIILDEEKQRLEASGVSQKELENNQSARMKNYGDKEKALGQLEQRRRNREKITAWFSNMKVDFLVGDMPRLVFVGRHVYQRVHLPDNPPHNSSFASNPRTEELFRPAINLQDPSSNHSEPARSRDSDIEPARHSRIDEVMAMELEG